VDNFSYGALVRLFLVAGRYWREIDGACARAGVDPLGLPLTRFLHLVLDWTQEHVDPEEWDRVRAEIFSPLDSGDPNAVSADVVEEEMSMFAAFTRQNSALEGGR
jgi:hypothetical protein